MTIDEKKIISVGKKLDNIQCCDARDGVIEASKLLEEGGAPLTDLQKQVIMFAVEVAHRNESDTWDHEFQEHPALGECGESIARLLQAYLDD